MATLYSSRRRVHSRAARYAALQSEGGGAGARERDGDSVVPHHATSLDIFFSLWAYVILYLNSDCLDREDITGWWVMNSCDW